MPDTAAGPVLFKREDRVGWVTLNRPDKSNALDTASLDALCAVLAAAEADPQLRVLVLAAQGRTFCAGADLREVDGPRRDAFLDLLHQTFTALRRFPKPVIGAINGLALAGGLELALCCDLLVAADSARLGDGHVLFGLVPGGGAATLLPLRIGQARARQLLFTGRTESAATLRDWGLVNTVVPPGELVNAAGELAADLALLSPEALSLIKAMSTPPGPDDRLLREARSMRAHLGTASAREGLAAFGQRRRPDFG